jgi:hypothetical protein
VQGSIEINGNDATARCLCHEARAGLERATTETTAYGLTACGARTMAGCLRAVPTGTCGSTSPPFPETSSRAELARSQQSQVTFDANPR